MTCIYCTNLSETWTAQVIGPLTGRSKEEVEGFIRQIHVANNHDLRSLQEADAAARATSHALP